MGKIVTVWGQRLVLSMLVLGALCDGLEHGTVAIGLAQIQSPFLESVISCTCSVFEMRRLLLRFIVTSHGMDVDHVSQAPTNASSTRTTNCRIRRFDAGIFYTKSTCSAGIKSLVTAPGKSPTRLLMVAAGN